MASKKDAQALIGRILKDVDEDIQTWDLFVTRADKRYRAYRGLIEKRSEAAQWTNKQHPAYVLQSIETMVGNLIDSSPKWRLKVNPLMGSPEQLAQQVAGARANELLLQHQLTVDHFAEKQRPFDLQALITGLTVSRQFWNYEEGTRRHLQTVHEPILDFFGQQVGSQPKVREAESYTVFHDDPTTEIVDVRDFIPEAGAVSLAKCSRVTERKWFSFSELESLVKRGIYGPDAGGLPIDGLKESRNFGDSLYSRENDLFEVTKAKDKIEVLECWIENGTRFVAIANRKLLLADKPNPFWFEQLEHRFPYVVCSALPDLFVIPGISEVELMAELQEMLWSLLNQRLDNLQLINNAIFLVSDQIDDPDGFEFAPGERWLVPPPVDQNIKSWSPDPRVAELSLQAEALLKGDLQNVTGGMPFLGGTDSGTVDQKTATGVSIVTSLAQKRLAVKKQFFIWAKQRIGEQWCALNQQFVREPRLVSVIGEDGAQAFEEIRPEMLQGSYAFDAEMVDESFLRQERRAEAQARLQVAMQAAPIMAGLGSPLNVRQFMEDFLEQFDVADTQRYFASQPQQGGMPPQQPGMPPPQGGPPQGVTAPQSVAADTSPSNPTSLSPMVMASRALAQRGGPVNV